MDIKYKIKNGLARLADQEEALKDPYTACLFACSIPGADIEKCQEVVCKNPQWAYKFALYVPGVDIEKCQEAVCKYPHYAYCFVRDVTGANIKMSLEACRGTHYEDKLNRYLMDIALL